MIVNQSIICNLFAYMVEQNMSFGYGLDFIQDVQDGLTETEYECLVGKWYSYNELLGSVYKY